MNTVKGVKKEEIEAFARYAGCFTYQSSIDKSRTAFNNCHDYEASTKAYYDALKDWKESIDDGDDDDSDDEDSGSDDDSDDEDSDSDDDSDDEDLGSDDDSDDEDSGRDDDSDDEDNGSDGKDRDAFVEDIIKFWDNYLDYTDKEFAQYLYEFPLYLAEHR